MVLVQGFHMLTVGGPAFSPIKQGRQYYCFKDEERGLDLDVPILKLSLPQHRKSPAGSTYTVVSLIIKDSSCGKKTAKAGK